MKFQRLLLIGDDWGLKTLLRCIPEQQVAGIMIAEIRPQFHNYARALALENRVPLLVQPRRRSPSHQAFFDSFQRLRPDGIVCNSYSMLLPDEMLGFVKGNAFNFHFSLLPKNRGPNPVQWAIIRGESETGISFHRMVSDVDAGEVFAQIRIPILEDDSWVSLRQRLFDNFEQFAQEAIESLNSGGLTPRPQSPTQATQNPRLTADFPRIQFSKMGDQEIYNLIRAQVTPLRGAFIENSLGERHYFPQMLSRQEIARLRAELA